MQGWYGHGNWRLASLECSRPFPHRRTTSPISSNAVPLHNDISRPPPPPCPPCVGTFWFSPLPGLSIAPKRSRSKLPSNLLPCSSPKSKPFPLSNMSRHPAAKWAQRSDKIYLTIELPDAKDVKLKLEPEGKFVFSATKDGVPYAVDIGLLDEVDVEESKVSVGVRSIVYVIQKSEKKWWSRLLKQEGKPPAFLKVDWDKWVDEEEEEKKGFDFDDMDFSKLDMGGDDDLDVDDFKDGEEEVETKEEDTKRGAEPAAEADGETKV